MKKFVLFLIVCVLLLTACLLILFPAVHHEKHQMDVSGENLKHAQQGLTDVAFDAGVQCAINTHLEFCTRELTSGRQPSCAGRPIDAWRAAARQYWHNAYPASDLISTNDVEAAVHLLLNQ